jgi:hypothetical protein
MAVNPAGDHLYFSLPSVVPPIGNSVLPFDVATGSFESPVWVGSEPDLAAVSADGQHLHVALDGGKSIVRLSLPGLKPEEQFQIASADGKLMDACFLLSLPASPASVIADPCFGSDLDQSFGVAMYDDGVPRPQRTTSYVGRTGSPTQGPLVDEAQLSDDGTVLYGEQGEFDGSQLSRWLITPQSLQFDSAGTSFGYQLYLDLACQHSLCLTGSGYIADTNTLQFVRQQLGDFANDGLALMDLDNNRMFLLVYYGADAHIQCYDATTYKLSGEYVIPQWEFANSFKKIIGDRLAIANGEGLILLPISLLQPPPG